MRNAKRKRRAATCVALVTAVAGVTQVRPTGAEEAEPMRPAFGNLEKRQDAQTTYSVNTYGIVHMELGSRGLIFDSKDVWWRAVRGTYRTPVSYDAFFRELGRPDLADQFTRRFTTGTILFYAGAVAMLGGLLGGVWQLSEGHRTAAIVCGGAFVGGYVAAGVGSALQKPALPEDAAAGMATRYNRSLGAHLGVSVAGGF